MSEFSTLLPVNAETPERLTVSARDLHTALEVKTSFKDWFPRMCEYGFEEGREKTRISAYPAREREKG